MPDVFCVSQSLFQRSFQNLNRLNFSIISQSLRNIDLISMLIQIFNIYHIFVARIWNNFYFNIIKNGIGLKCLNGSLYSSQIFELYLGCPVRFPGKPFKY